MIMISIPMNYKGWQNDYATVKKKLEQQGYTVTPLHISDIYEKTPVYQYELKSIPLIYMSNSFARMAVSDTIYFVRGWENARGCRLEHQAALDYGLKIIDEDNI